MQKNINKFFKNIIFTVLQILTVLFVFYILLLTFCSNQELSPVKNESVTAKEENTTTESMAWIQCKQFIQRNIAPTGYASFPFMEFSSNLISEKTYMVFSYFDAQNFYGAMVRKEFSCKIKYLKGDDADNKNWELIEFNFI